MTTAQPDFLHRLETKLEDTARVVGQDLLAIGEEVVNTGEKLLEQLIDIGAPIAMQAVVGQIPMIATGQEKFGVAVTSTFQQLESKGLPLLIQDAQMLVQAAFRKAQQLFGSDVVSKNVTPAAS